ncbi:hypothetical protein Bhyg_07646, partial [Pseudolycoriella hygida]
MVSNHFIARKLFYLYNGRSSVFTTSVLLTCYGLVVEIRLIENGVAVPKNNFTKMKRNGKITSARHSDCPMPHTTKQKHPLPTVSSVSKKCSAKLEGKVPAKSEASEPKEPCKHDKKQRKASKLPVYVGSNVRTAGIETTIDFKGLSLVDVHQKVDASVGVEPKKYMSRGTGTDNMFEPVLEDADLHRIHLSLEEEATYKFYEQTLAKLSGTDMHDTVKVIAQKMISDSVLKNYSYCGRRKKEPFNKYYNVTNVIVSSTVKSMKRVHKKDKRETEEETVKTRAEVHHYFTMEYIKKATKRFQSTNVDLLNLLKKSSNNLGLMMAKIYMGPVSLNKATLTTQSHAFVDDNEYLQRRGFLSEKMDQCLVVRGSEVCDVVRDNNNTTLVPNSSNRQVSLEDNASYSITHGDRRTTKKVCNFFTSEQAGTAASSTTIFQNHTITSQPSTSSDYLPAITSVEEADNYVLMNHGCNNNNTRNSPIVITETTEVLTEEEFERRLNDLGDNQTGCHHNYSTKRILSNDARGKMVLKSFDQNRKFSESDLLLLIDVILDYHFSENMNKLSNGEIDKIADRICKEFPNVDKKCFYIPSFNGSAPTGMLFQRYNYKLKKFRRQGLIPTSINSDFERKYGGDTSNALISGWDTVFAEPKVLFTLLKDKCCLKMLKAGRAPTADNIKHASNSLALHGLFIPTLRGAGDGSTFKPTIIDSQDSFLLLTTLNLVDDAIKERERKCASKRLNGHPFIVGICKIKTSASRSSDRRFTYFVWDVDEIESFQVVFDTAVYQCQDFLTAVDICFKIYSIFQIPYPESKNVWIFFDQSFYKTTIASTSKYSIITPSFTFVSLMKNNTAPEYIEYGCYEFKEQHYDLRLMDQIFLRINLCISRIKQQPLNFALNYTVINFVLWKILVNMVRCFICPTQFDDAGQLCQHMQNVHKIRGQNRYECTLCSGCFSESYLFKRHVEKCLLKLKKRGNERRHEQQKSDSRKLFWKEKLCMKRSEYRLNLWLNVPSAIHVKFTQIINVFLIGFLGVRSKNNTGNFIPDDGGVKLRHFEESIRESALKFTLEFSSDMILPRNFTYKIIEECKKILTVIVDGVETIFLPLLTQNSDKELAQGFSKICNSMFSGVETEHRLDENLKKAGLMGPLTKFPIGVYHETSENESYIINWPNLPNIWKTKTVAKLFSSKNTKIEPTISSRDPNLLELSDDENNEDISESEDRVKIAVGTFMPLQCQIKKFFEEKDVFATIMQNERKIRNENQLNHFINGSIWKSKLSAYNADQTVIPYYLYSDETQVNNALGTHCAKGLQSCVYYTFPTIPGKYASRLENIFVAMLFSAKDEDNFGSNSCYEKLVEELDKLARERIEILVDGVEKVIFFVLGVFLGDNKSLNKTFGFSSCSANCFCRICKLVASECQKRTVEDESMLRTEANYAEDVEKNTPFETGIQWYSIFNKIYLFHGVLRYNMSEIILYFTNNKFFTLKELNRRKKIFSYDYPDRGNKSKDIIKKEYFEAIENSSQWTNITNKEVFETKTLVINSVVLSVELFLPGNKMIDNKIELFEI